MLVDSCISSVLLGPKFPLPLFQLYPSFSICSPQKILDDKLFLVDLATYAPYTLPLIDQKIHLGESSDQLMARYMEHMWPNLLKRACHPIFFGESISKTMDIVGIEGAEIWDQAALMRYKSRRAFVEIATHPDMQDRHKFKTASLGKQS